MFVFHTSHTHPGVAVDMDLPGPACLSIGLRNDLVQHVRKRSDAPESVLFSSESLNFKLQASTREYNVALSRISFAQAT